MDATVHEICVFDLKIFRLGGRPVGDYVGHPGFHVVKVVTVVKPTAGVVGRELHVNALHRVDDDRVFEHPLLAGKRPVDHSKEVAVQVHRMGHHAVVAISQAYAFAFVDR
jgi:hypothetical protein